MVAKIIPVDSFNLVVFGATGDLSRNKLMPALFCRFIDKQIPDDFSIIGVARTNMPADAFRQDVAKLLRDKQTSDEKDDDSDIARFLRKSDEKDIARFVQHINYCAVDIAGQGGWEKLANLLKECPRKVCAYYLAIRPELYGPLCQKLAELEMNRGNTRIVLEKPLGSNLQEAKLINSEVTKAFREEQIYRIDHYLGKETVQNLLALRFANRFIGNSWDETHIDHVQISVLEGVGVEKREGYYDKAGALRDMVQNHLLQLLCLVAMEAPVSVADADQLRDRKLEVLKALKTIKCEDVATHTARGQYRAGKLHGKDVKGYLDELGEGKASSTETFVAIRCYIQNTRWSDMPFYLRTGKRLGQKVSEIVVQFKEMQHWPFDTSKSESANRLVIRLQPNESIKMHVMIKEPGPGGMRLSPVSLDMTFDSLTKHKKIHVPEAYERLLMDVIRGSQTLFMRNDEVEAAWKWIDPIIEHWQQKDQPELQSYAPGEEGPASACALIENDDRCWAKSDA